METNSSGSTQLFIRSALRLGESVLWHAARQCLFWVDLLDPALFSSAPGAEEAERRILPFDAPVGSVAATTDPDRLVVSQKAGLSLLDLRDFSIVPFADPEAGRDAVIFNDLKCDRWGRLWVSTSHAREVDPRGALWCVAAPDRMALGDAGFPVSNGPAVSPDGRQLYFNDSMNRQTLVYDISAGDLHPRNRRVLASYSPEEGMPDGLTVDAEGNIWTAQWGGGCVIRLAPDGRKLAKFEVPAPNVTSLCFAGPGLDALFITTARDGLDAGTLAHWPLSGSLFRLDPGTHGLPEPLFPLPPA